MTCHSKKCHRPRTSSCQKEQRVGTPLDSRPQHLVQPLWSLPLPLTAAVTTPLANTPLPTCHRLHLLQSVLPHLAMLIPPSTAAKKQTDKHTWKVCQLQEGCCVEPPKNTIGWIPKTMDPDHRPMQYPSMHPDPRRLQPVPLVSAAADQSCPRRSLLAAGGGGSSCSWY